MRSRKHKGEQRRGGEGPPWHVGLYDDDLDGGGGTAAGGVDERLRRARTRESVLQRKLSWLTAGGAKMLKAERLHLKALTEERRRTAARRRILRMRMTPIIHMPIALPSPCKRAWMGPAMMRVAVTCAHHSAVS